LEVAAFDPVGRSTSQPEWTAAGWVAGTTFSAHTMTLSQLHAASLSHVALVTGLEGYMGYTGSFAAVYRGYMGWQSRKADNAKC